MSVDFLSPPERRQLAQALRRAIVNARL